jgi:hypothetical protein
MAPELLRDKWSPKEDLILLEKQGELGKQLAKTHSGGQSDNEPNFSVCFLDREEFGDQQFYGWPDANSGFIF